MSSDSPDNTTYKYSVRSPTGLAEDEPPPEPPVEPDRPQRSGHSRSSLSPLDRWTKSRPDRPWVSHHAQQRWDERMPSWSRSIEYAYTCSVPLDELNIQLVFGWRDPGSGIYTHPNRVRAFGEHHDGSEYIALLILNSRPEESKDTIVTTYQLAGAEVSAPVKRYVYSLLESKGHFDSETDPHEGCR